MCSSDLKGEKDGISEGLGVVCNGNVLGVVQYVSRNYSAVLLAMSAKMKLSGMIKNDGHLCTVIWDKVSTSKAEIEDIPYHIDVKIVLCLGHILTKDGRKMSKHLGNILLPIPLMDEHGTDAAHRVFAAST